LRRANQNDGASAAAGEIRNPKHETRSETRKPKHEIRIRQSSGRTAVDRCDCSRVARLARRAGTAAGDDGVANASRTTKIFVDNHEGFRTLGTMTLPKRTRVARPTRAELAVLAALWRLGPSTVRAVLAELEPGTGYTTALKIMQLMLAKGLLRREVAGRSHVYRAAVPEAQTLRQIAGDLLDRAFAGSSRKLLVAALSARRASAEELDEMRQLIDAARAERKDKP
jgi:BlaI family penicillinase repressor